MHALFSPIGMAARALTTGAWLAQLGWEAFVYTPPPLAALETGPEPVRVLTSFAPAGQVAPSQADTLVREGLAVVFDVDRRASYEKAHIPGARFSVPDRLPAL